MLNAPEEAAQPRRLALATPNGTPGALVGKADEQPLLAQYWQIVDRWRWLVLASIAVALLIGAIFTVLATREYVATATLEISREADSAEGLSAEGSPPLGADREFYQTQYGLLRSKSLARRVATELDLITDERFINAFDVGDEGDLRPATRQEREARLKEAQEVLLENLTIDPTIESRLVDVSFASPDPVLSARIANAWAENFIQTSLERRFESASYAREFLEDRLDQLRGRLETGERSLVGYATQQGIVNLNSDASGTDEGSVQSVAANNLELLNAALAQATADRVAAQSRLGQISGDAQANPAVATMRRDRAALNAQLANMLVQFEPEYPAARALQSQIDSLDAAIAQEERRMGAGAREEYQSALQRESALGSRVENLKQEVLDLRRRGIQYNILQRDVDTSRELYQALLQRYKEIGIAGGIGRNNIAIVDQAAAPDSPSSPKPLLNMILALILGAGAGVALAFGLHQLDEGITDPEKIPEHLGVPSFGNIPRSSDDVVESLLDPKSELSEAYMALRTSLEFSTPAGIPRNFFITSSRSGEGKSTTALGLAVVIARLGSRVLLVDSDVRSPSVHHLLQIENTHGLSGYLTGQDEFAAIVRTTQLKNLSVVSAGPQPPNAAELLAGDGITRLLEQAERHFDYVVIDAPPVLGLADAPLLGGKIDAGIFVIQAGATKTRVAQRAINRLWATQTRLLGAVLTMFEPKFSAYNYGDVYGYSYGADKARSA